MKRVLFVTLALILSVFITLLPVLPLTGLAFSTPLGNPVANPQENGDQLVANETYNYVIITSNLIRNNSAKLDIFISHKENCGYRVLLITEDEFGMIDGQAPNHRAEKIRKWLQNNYVDLGIEYVLLIGDPSPYESGEGDIPMKLCWPAYPIFDAPTDYFYADLTGDWDFDGDQIYGEAREDHIKDGGVDLEAEVFVGRIPVYNDSFSTLDNILQKTIDYENEGSELEWRKNVLLPMAYLGLNWNGASLAEEIKTDYLDPYGFSSWRMYQNSSNAESKPGYKYEELLVGGTAVKNTWAAGKYGIVVWYAHGDATHARIRNEDPNDGSSDILFQSSYCSALNDAYPSFTFQLTCANGLPTQADNMQYALLKQGGIATVGPTSNAHIQSYYGYGNFDDHVPQPSCLGYEYIKGLVENKSGGQALYEAKQNLDIWADPSSSNLRNLYIFNLYGDPSVSLLGTEQIITCDSKGNSNNCFLPGEIVNIKGGGGLENNTEYIVFIRQYPINQGSFPTQSNVLPEGDSNIVQRLVVTNNEGRFDTTPLWSIPPDISSRGNYRVFADKWLPGIAMIHVMDRNSELISSLDFAVATKIFVDAKTDGKQNGLSWESAFRDLQDALAIAEYGDTILVAAGTYMPTKGTGDDSRYCSFRMKKGVSIIGGYPNGGGVRDVAIHISVLSGDIGALGNPKDNSYHVIFNENIDDNTRIDGFVITSGNANGDRDENADSGGGILNSDSSPDITNCVFSKNGAKYGGGMYNLGSTLKITNCSFVDNHSSSSGGGIYNYQKSYVTITDCTFTNNVANTWGGGLCNFSSKSEIRNCVFSNNQVYDEIRGKGDAIFHTASGKVEVFDSTFVQNIANTTGTVIFTSTNNVSVEDCTFIDY